ncbi:MAG: hypothetical protein WC490_04920 [Candidatus Margulisiibacteriota bacterium]
MNPLGILGGLLPTILQLIAKKSDAKASAEALTVIGKVGIDGLPAEGMSIDDMSKQYGIAADKLRKLDNGDGKLTKDELLKADKNGDGALTKGEISRFASTH